MKKADWDPGLYLKFGRERIQPSIDLVSRIDYDRPSKIIDIGCGPGNSTRVLFSRWPGAKITGADNSPAMIEKARMDYPDQTWILFDAGNDEMDEQFDIVFSNAAIQWIPDHENLLGRFASFLETDGVLAVQVPLFWDMPVGKSLLKIADNPRWRTATAKVKDSFTIHDPHTYFDLLSRHFRTIDMWMTDYMHVMESHQSILEMIRSTGLKPYHERLSDTSLRQDFETEVLESITEEYPPQLNGEVLFPFRRLFFVCRSPV